MNLIELNQAFASRSLACIRELNLNVGKTNPNGGASALGHSILGAGAVILSKLIHQIKRADQELGPATMGVDGGLGAAVLLKNLV